MKVDTLSLTFCNLTLLRQGQGELKNVADCICIGSLIVFVQDVWCPVIQHRAREAPC